MNKVNLNMLLCGKMNKTDTIQHKGHVVDLLAQPEGYVIYIDGTCRAAVRCLRKQYAADFAMELVDEQSN